jgi:hypothetical protein
MQKEHNPTVGEHQQYVGPFRLEKTLGKGQTGKINFYAFPTRCAIINKALTCTTTQITSPFVNRGMKLLTVRVTRNFSSHWQITADS